MAKPALAIFCQWAGIWLHINRLLVECRAGGYVRR